MKLDEKVCWACNADVPEKNPKPSAHSRFQKLINGLFLMFAVMTPLSLVLPDGYVPSFMKCFAGTLVLYLVRSSILHMSETRKN